MNAQPIPVDLPGAHYEDAQKNETALFGACVLEPSRIDELSEIVAPHCFHNQDIGKAFSLLVELHHSGKPLRDTTLLVTELRKAGLFDKFGVSAFIGLACSQGIAANALYYAHEVRNHWHLRELFYSLSRGVKDCIEPKAVASVIAQSVEAALNAARYRTSSELESIDTMISDAIAEIEKARSEGQTFGIPTRFPTVDRETGGFFNGDLTILAARPSIGKSALAVDVAARVAERGFRVLIVSLEMTSKQIAHRLLNRETGIPIRQMQTGELDSHENSLLASARAKLRELPIRALVTSNATLSKIRALTRVAMAQDGVDLLIVDYLGLIGFEGRASSYERMTAISRDMKGLAMELNRPILALAQLNREAAKSDYPTLEHLRDSGAIEQDADNVWLLHRENRDSTEAKLIVAKQRQGPIGTISLTFDASRMRFQEPDFVEWNG